MTLREQRSNYARLRQGAKENAMSTPRNPLDVAESVMQSHGGRPTAKQVQKLAFYAHAVHLARFGEPLVAGGFQAWRHGPVSPIIYDRQRGDYAPTTVRGDPSMLDDDARESVRLAVEIYGDRSESELISLSHGDGPWTLARGEIPPTASSRQPIPDEVIDKVLAPTIRKLIDAYSGRRLTLDQFRAEFAA